MKKVSFAIASICMIAQLHSNDSVSSEVSHVAGGTVMAGGITAVVDHYYPEYRSDRGMIGFWVSSVSIIAFESVNVAIHGDAKGQLLDVASHMAGSALGAFVTDKYILTPVISSSSVEGKYIGLGLQRTF